MSQSAIDAALSKLPIEDQRCLEAGAGAGNTSETLLSYNPAAVYAVSNDPEHLTTVDDRFESDSRLAPVLSDLQHIPLSAGSIDLVTAHALFNVVTPPELSRICTELTRVTRQGGHLILVDYEPIPDTQVQELFALENAVSELTSTRPALVFYPSKLFQRVFSAAGWTCLETGSALDPVPWTDELLDAHVRIIEDKLEQLPDAISEPLDAHTQDVRAKLRHGVETGSMYYHIYKKEASKAT